MNKRMIVVGVLLACAWLGTGRAQEQQATVTIRIVASAAACADTTYWFVYGTEYEGFYQQLGDNDGDGVYSTTFTDTIGSVHAVQLVQGRGTVNLAFGPEPGEPRTLLRDAGIVTITSDTVFEATGRPCSGTLPATGIERTWPLVALLAALVLAAGLWVRSRSLRNVK